jgi:hypothetical protein
MEFGKRIIQTMATAPNRTLYASTIFQTNGASGNRKKRRMIFFWPMRTVKKCWGLSSEKAKSGEGCP